MNLLMLRHGIVTLLWVLLRLHCTGSSIQVPASLFLMCGDGWHGVIGECVTALVANTSHAVLLWRPAVYGERLTSLKHEHTAHLMVLEEHCSSMVVAMPCRN